MEEMNMIELMFCQKCHGWGRWRVVRGNVASSYGSIDVLQERYGVPEEGNRRAFVQWVLGLYQRVHDTLVFVKVVDVKS
jgi:hypothetical protein